MTRRTLEIESLADFDAHLAATRSLHGWFIQSVDLTGRVAELRAVDPHGAVFLGCELSDAQAVDLRTRGAMLFPRLPDLPFDPYRPGLYDAAELYGGGPYAESVDAAIYAWSQSGQHTLDRTLAAALHDHAITDALDEEMARIPAGDAVGVMGGHTLLRDGADYRLAAQLGCRLATAGKTVVTGGGPGAMEAANFGAYLSPWPDRLDEALGILAEIPSYRPRVDAWAAQAFRVRDRWPLARAGSSIGIPTWFYGHEPSNPFATRIAKYFTNALREDSLLQRCGGGIIYLPGAAGTVQEIFQAVTENFYAADDTQVTPMVLVGRDYWTEEFPAWPLLQRLGHRRPMAASIHCVEDIAAAAEIVLG
ncbi:LOG family protein [Microlunatus panaciterrae]|uniref:Rossmann-fold nucleotide-binding protein n=1 Tax=Microlunatus panaciterrae TaxID=400768 RepID=A0ABS2RNS0_9ACTN|nr:LOG family protein [Microlunatus panaciterrae]MBM7800313.1 putative Rossmann-fold nucleotide-binding protein [Microlunatus panaciterrae]